MAIIQTANMTIIDHANATGRVVIRYAGIRPTGDYGGTDFVGRAWEVETSDGRTIVPERLAVIIARHFVA